MEEGRLDDAERVFRDCLDQHGDDGTILTNLAKVYSRRHDDSAAETILRRALEIDPNQENGLGWYRAIQRERAGEAAELEVLRDRNSSGQLAPAALAGKVGPGNRSGSASRGLLPRSANARWPPRSGRSAHADERRPRAAW